MEISDNYNFFEDMFSVHMSVFFRCICFWLALLIMLLSAFCLSETWFLKTII
jgi:hypothetical protein